jgi:hypothetical protein
MVGQGSARLLFTAVVAAVLLAPAANATPSAAPATSPYAGLGTWLSIYAKKDRRDPAPEIAAMARDGVRTLYLETGNYRSHHDLVRPWEIGPIVDAAHAAGMRVVAWYLPSFASLARDERRALDAIDFRSASGERFDGFALDIEATVVHALPLRDRRLLQLSTWLRQQAGPGYPLGAITPSPIGMSPYYWPGIPYRQLARIYDVFLPMAYSTDRDVSGTKRTRAYLTETVAAIRAASGDPRLPIHLIGGLSGRMGAKETAGFIQAVKRSDLLGYSLYAFPHTSAATWQALAAAFAT